jgi:hypothetical protein
MRFHAQQGYRGEVIDWETGNIVPKVLWLDLDTGELEAYQLDPHGNILTDSNGNLLTYQARGNFRFFPREFREKKLPAAAALACVKCTSPLTLPGEELCPRCFLADRGKPLRDPPVGSPLRRPCEVCEEPASWCVADEVPVSPVLHRGFLFSRGATIGRRYYCVRHWQPPRILDARGEVMEVEEAAGGVRPD